MKFDYAIGNPPYQANVDTYNRQEPVYSYFYEEAERAANKYLLISPARFLFNAGLTPKEWNRKMLEDSHVKVEFYTGKSSDIFPSVEIKGGIAIVYRDADREFGAIREFFADENMRNLSKLFVKGEKKNLPAIMYGGRSDLKFNDVFLKNFPESVQLRLEAIQRKHPNAKELGPNEEYELKSSTLDILDSVFIKDKPTAGNFYKIVGLSKGKRTSVWIDRKYMTPRYPQRNNVTKFKVCVAESNGSGEFGITLSTPFIAKPFESTTPTFISIGAYDTEYEANSTLKYVKTKLVRALLCLLKTTQHNSVPNWSYIPLQDFTPNSDINWSASIRDIDQQLYKKYGLSQQEIDFIESHVKEMA